MGVNKPDCLQSSDLLAAILGGVRHCVLLCDHKHSIIYANQAASAVLGHDLVGKKVSRIFMPDDQEHLAPNLMHLAATAQTFDGEVMLQRAGGQGFFAMLTLRSFSEPGKKPITMLSIENIDRQKRSESLLSQAHYDELMAVSDSIAHKLRNPLVGIGGFVNRLYKSCRISSRQDEYYKHIVKDLNRIENLVRQVRDLMSLSPPKLTRLDLTQIITQALEPYRPRLEQRGIHLENRSEPLTLLGDGGLLSRCFAILIENALDAVGPGGRIEVQARASGGQARISFCDSGPGIAPEDIGNVFNPFFSTKADGVGMDLALLGRIVRSHGGTVMVTSPPGQGACFHLDLPLERRRSIRTAPLPGVETKYGRGVQYEGFGP